MLALGLCLAATACTGDQVRPNVELGLQLSGVFCSAVLDAEPARGDTIGKACRAFLNRPAPAPAAAADPDPPAPI